MKYELISNLSSNKNVIEGVLWRPGRIGAIHSSEKMK